MSRSRWGGIALIAAALIVAGIGLERSATRGNDFDNFYDAGVSVLRERALLEEKGIFRYPPTFQVAMAPLGAFPIEVAAGLWLLVNGACLASLPWALGRLAGTPPARQGFAWFAVAPFVVSNVTLGQSGPLLLALCSLGMLAAARRRPVLGGAALAVAGLLKVFPGALLAVPVALGRARGALLGAGLAVALAALALTAGVGAREGADDWLRWAREVRREQTPQRMIEEVRSLRYNNQGLAITLVRSLSTDFSHAPQLAAKGSVQVLSLPSRAVFGLYYALLALLAGVLGACALRARRRPTPRVFLGLYALSIPATLALTPVVWTHYFLWLAPACVYLADRTRLLGGLGVASLLAIFWVPARGLGFHMGLALLLFGLVAVRLWRETAPEPSPAAQ